MHSCCTIRLFFQTSISYRRRSCKDTPHTTYLSFVFPILSLHDALHSISVALPVSDSVLYVHERVCRKFTRQTYCSSKPNFAIAFFFLPPLKRRPSRAGPAVEDVASDVQKRLDKPSVPIVAKGDPGPPRIVEIQEKYSAVEGEEFKQMPCILKIKSSYAKTFCRTNGCVLHVHRGQPRTDIQIQQGDLFSNVDGINYQKTSLRCEKCRRGAGPLAGPRHPGDGPRARQTCASRIRGQGGGEG